LKSIKENKPERKFYDSLYLCITGYEFKSALGGAEKRRGMLLWWKEYLGEWKLNLFLIIQIVFSLFLVNSSVSSLVGEYAQLSFATETESDMYFYQNAMGVLTDEWGLEGFTRAVDAMSRLDGFEGMAYQASLECEVAGYENKVSQNTMVNSVYLSPLLYKGLMYHLKDGRWFQEKDEGTDRLHVVIGGGLSEKYRVGDILTVEYDGKPSKEALVIGDLGTKFYLLSDSSYASGGRYLSSYAAMHGREEDFLLLNNEKWLGEFCNDAVYPSVSTVIKVKKGSDLSVYETYGVLASFDEVMQNTREQCKNFTKDAVRDSGIWILVIIFGGIGTSYLIAKKRRYLWGVYSLMGMKGNRLLLRLMSQNVLTYLLGGAAAIVLSPYIAKVMNYWSEITVVNIIAVAVLMGIMLLINYLCNRYIKYIEPKEILNQTKE